MRRAPHVHSAVGWAKAVALPFLAAQSLVRRAHHLRPSRGDSDGGHGAREESPHGKAVPAPLPTLQFECAIFLMRTAPARTSVAHWSRARRVPRGRARSG